MANFKQVQQDEIQYLFESFGMNLRSARLERNLTQVELSKFSKIKSTEVISKYETGYRLPSLYNLIKLADALNVSIDYLVNRVTEKDSPITNTKLLKEYNQLSLEQQNVVLKLVLVLNKKVKTVED